MSIFSGIGKALGSVGKAVGKVALNVGGNYIGDSHLGTDLFTSAPKPLATTYNPLTGAATAPVAASPSILDELKGLLDVASGNKPIQTTVESSALPSWLLPLGVVGILVLGFMALSGSKK